MIMLLIYLEHCTLLRRLVVALARANEYSEGSGYKVGVDVLYEPSQWPEAVQVVTESSELSGKSEIGSERRTKTRTVGYANRES